MAIPTLNKDGIQEFASGIFYICECDADGTTTGTFTRFGYFDGSGFDDARSSTGKADESGNIVKNTKGTREIMQKINQMQMDASTLEFAPKESIGKYYHTLYRTTGDPIGGSHDWLMVGITEVEPSMSRSSPGSGPEVTFKAVANSAALSIDASTVDAGLLAFAIAADEIWAIKSVAVV